VSWASLAQPQRSGCAAAMRWQRSAPTPSHTNHTPHVCQPGGWETASVFKGYVSRDRRKGAVAAVDTAAEQLLKRAGGAREWAGATGHDFAQRSAVWPYGSAQTETLNPAALHAVVW
jgi:hypothetical protein